MFSFFDRFRRKPDPIVDPKPYIERMLEIENLTDELEDRQARQLLEWGTAQLNRLLQSYTEPDLAGEKANALYAVLRKINRLHGARADKEPAALVSDLAALAELAAGAYGVSPRQTPADCETAAARLPALEADPALALLTAWALYAAGQSETF